MKAHQANVPGDFYVEDECCLRCGVPQALAPELFSAIDDEADHCYVRKQPSTEADLHRMLKVIHGQELGCIRYRGNERAIQAQLIKLGDGGLCDSLPADLQWQRVRNWVLLKFGGTR